MVDPPSWDPANRSYTLSQYFDDLTDWLTVTRYQPHEQGVIIAHHLEGAARQLRRSWTHAQLQNGRMDMNGNMVDPITMIVMDLTNMFAPRMEDDQRATDLELMNFKRHPHETFELMMVRFRDVLRRQRQEGYRLFSWKEHSDMILRNCGISEQLIVQLFVERGTRNGGRHRLPRDRARV